MSWQQSRIKKTKSTNSKNKIVFSSKYNSLGPNKSIIQKHAHILDNYQIMQNKEIMVAYKHEKNLKELLTKADTYNIINNVDDEMHTYVPCKQRCDSWANFVVTKSSFECFPTERVSKVRWSPSCVSKNVIYIAFCLNCLKQGVRSTVDWKPRLQNYKSHIMKNVQSCSIVNHFIDVCSDTDHPSRNACQHMIKYYPIWALMLKIKLKNTNLLDFVSSSLFSLENEKLTWNSYWHKSYSYKRIHTLALQSRKLRLRESSRMTLSYVLVFGIHEFKRPPLTAFKTFLYTLRMFQTNRILTMSIFSSVILNGYKFTD